MDELSQYTTLYSLACTSGAESSSAIVTTELSRPDASTSAFTASRSVSVSASSDASNIVSFRIHTMMLWLPTTFAAHSNDTLYTSKSRVLQCASLLSFSAAACVVSWIPSSVASPGNTEGHSIQKKFTGQLKGEAIKC